MTDVTIPELDPAGPITGAEVIPGIQDGGDVGITLSAVLAEAQDRANHTGTQPQSSVDGLVAALASKAAVSAVVRLTTDQNIAGIKTFSSAPVVPNDSWSVAKTAGLQDALDAVPADADLVHDTGDEMIAGIKTFSSSPIVPTPTTSTQAANKAYVDGISGVAGIRVEDEGSTVVALATGLNFVGGGVTATNAGSNEVTVTIPSVGIRVEDEGTSTVAAASGLNFVGGGVTVTDAGSNEATVTVHAPAGVDPRAHGAVFDGTTDDTAAINAALAAAGATGRVILPVAVIAIAGRVAVTGSQSLVGAGAGWVGTVATSLKCTAAGAGLDVTGGNGGEVANLTIDADNLATAPFKRLLDGAGGGGFKEFRNVYVFDSAQDGMTLLGPQNDTFVNCTVANSARDNLVIDRGTGGTAFLNWEDFACGRYGIRVEKTLVDGPYVEPQQISFHGGRTEFPDPGATSMLYMRGGFDIAFNNFALVGGNNLSGATVDIDQNLSGNIDLSTAQTVSGTEADDTGVCIKLSGVGRRVFLGRHWFVGGHTSLYLATTTAQMAAGVPAVYADDGMLDGSTNGMRAPDYNAPASLRGRTGPWVAPTLLNSWVNEAVSGYPNAGYRITPGGELELRGGIKTGADGTVAFQVPIGYRPLSPGLYVTRVAPCAGGVCQVRLDFNGNVLITQLTGNVSTVTQLDGLTFPLGAS